jgi:hypothetical protein
MAAPFFCLTLSQRFPCVFPTTGAGGSGRNADPANKRESAGRAEPSLPGSKGCPLDLPKTLLGGLGGKKTPMFRGAAAGEGVGMLAAGRESVPHPSSTSPLDLLS